MDISKTILLYDRFQLECDGMTKVLSYTLTKLEIDHVVVTGYLSGPNGGIPHFWIELEDGSYIDLRARMWQGDTDNIPHGVFDPADYPDIDYDVSRKEKWVVDPFIYTILTGLQDILKA